MAVGLLSGCANDTRVVPGSGGSKSPAGAPTSVVVQESGTGTSAPPGAGGCSGGAAAFSLSLVPGLSGEPTPVKAAERFVVHGGIPGYGDASSRWQISARDSFGVTVTAGPVRLHALQLKDKTWAIDGGQRCA